MRKLFTDKWNSFWHFVFGTLSVIYFWIIPIFVAYQLMDAYEPNVLIDLSEFGIGYFVAYLGWKINHLYSQNTPINQPHH